MSVQIPQFGVLPNSATMTESQFNAAWNGFFNNVDAYGSALTALGVEVEANAANAAAAVAAVPNAKWVAGTYSDGDVRWSPTDYLDYRNKGSGTRNTDPALDPINWVPRERTGNGGADTTSSAVDITLTATSSRLQIISMTAPNKSIYAPAASTLTKGASIFVIRNAGTNRFAYRANGGRFVCYIQPGQIVALHCSDVSTLPGIWHVSGQTVDQIYNDNNAEVLNAVDSRYISVAMLSATQAICAFRNVTTTYLNAVVLNYGSSSGVPAQVAAQTAKDISIAAQTNNQATICYKTDTGTTRAVVLDITGSTTFAPGTDKQIDAGTGGGGTALTAQSSTQLLAFYQGAANTSPKMRVLDIVSSAITESAQVEADVTQCKAQFLVAAKVSPTKAALFFRNNANSRLHLRLQSISGSTPAPTGTLLDLTAMTGTISSAQFGAAVLSASRAVTIAQPNLDRWEMMASLYDISGTSPVLIGSKFFNVGAGAPLQITATALDANNVHVIWSGGASLGIDGCRLTISNDDRIGVSPVSERIEEKIASDNQYQAVVALDSAHVMQVCRNKDTYLSAKTLELAA
ncbi:MAG: hypothetical protein JNL77_07010 [Nitrosomonas sp.]|nr:hypothetical protein [Nitrosomonas sp.]